MLSTSSAFFFSADGWMENGMRDSHNIFSIFTLANLNKSQEKWWKIGEKFVYPSSKKATEQIFFISSSVMVLYFNDLWLGCWFFLCKRKFVLTNINPMWSRRQSQAVSKAIYSLFGEKLLFDRVEGFVNNLFLLKELGSEEHSGKMKYNWVLSLTWNIRQHWISMKPN